MSSGTKINEALKWAFVQLNEVSDTSVLDAEVILLHILGQNRTYLYTWPDRVIDEDKWLEFKTLIDKRLKGHPVAHIVGEREFWSLPFKVNDTTLIPRPDTEILVETALNLSLPDNSNVLDLGTGTGAIALALAYERPKWQVTAVDKIPEAVALATLNRDQLGLARVEICQSDWFSALANRSFELIVSNPPYIDDQDEHLTQGDVRFEPLTALTASEHGFADLFHIAICARNYLKPDGYLLMEHGYQQADILQNKLIQLGYLDVMTLRDFGGNERCTLGRWPGKSSSIVD